MKDLLKKVNNQKVLIYLKDHTGETNLAKISSNLDIEASLVTLAIQDLEEAKLIESRKEGKEKLVKINEKGLNNLLDINTNFMESDKFIFYFKKLKNSLTKRIAIQALKELAIDRKPKNDKFLDTFFEYIKSKAEKKEGKLKIIEQDYLEELLFILMHLCIKLRGKIIEEKRKGMITWLSELIGSDDCPLRLKEKTFGVWRHLYTIEGSVDILNELFYLIKTTDDENWNNVEIFVNDCISTLSTMGNMEDKIWEQLKNKDLDERSRKRYEKIVLKLTKKGIEL